MILILIFILIILLSITSEHFDAKITTTTVEECSNLCKQSAGCIGFAYDIDNNICYPSKTILSNISSPYHYDDNPDIMKCSKNKVFAYPATNIDEQSRFHNETYKCTDTDRNDPYYNIHNKHRFYQIADANDAGWYREIDEYNVKEFNWIERKLEEGSELDKYNKRIRKDFPDVYINEKLYLDK